MEYWVYEVCFMLCSDFCFICYCMLVFEKMGWKYKDVWMQEHEVEIVQLIQYIYDKGLVCLVDFEYFCKGVSGWWEWKLYKWYLEGLFIVGKVMVIEWCNFQCVYDLIYCVMFDWDDECDFVL